MTIRTFWTIFIKILGISLLIEGIAFIPQFMSMLTFVDVMDMKSSIYSGMVLLTVVVLYLLILRLFFFRPHWLIDKLKLDSGFTEDKIGLNFQPSKILAIGITIIAALMLIDSLPQLCKHAFIFYQQRNLLSESPTTGWLILELVKTFIGVFLITNSRKIAIFIDKRSSKPNDQQ
jgi:hypothetical protein